MSRVDNDRLWERRLDYAERHPVAYTAWWCVGIVCVVLLITGIVGVASTGSVFFQSAASNATLNSRVNIQRNNTQNATSSIAFFHDQCNGVVSKLAIYRVNEGRYQRLLVESKNDADPITQQQDRDQLDQASTDADGALNAALSAAADYNAKAANSLTSKFRESGLPERINVPADGRDIKTPDCG